MTKLEDLTLAQKAALTSGADAWHLQGIAGTDIVGHMITDGPHGLRKMRQGDDLSNLADAVKATCFPPAVGLSSSWDPELIKKVGVAIAQESAAEKVAVLLGPGVNIKRHPYGGRNFEYFSEDPFLAGKEAAAFVQGVQSQGIGTSLKHFAANNQETDRLRISAQVDERTLREIYLKPFEMVVKEAQPWTIMCSYNKINGVYSFENYWLLTEVLRKEWGFEGIVMSDWGACHDRVSAIKAGLNLEMPPSGTDQVLVAAVENGQLDEADLDAMAAGMIRLNRQVEGVMAGASTVDLEANAQLAREVAGQCAVLLKNDQQLLPLPKTDLKLAVIGEFARTPRFQGDGSSRVNAAVTTSLWQALETAAQTQPGLEIAFAPGFTLGGEEEDPGLAQEAVEIAQQADVVVAMLGLPAELESEGFDREIFSLPAKQLALLDRLVATNPKVVVVLSNGSVVEMASWKEQPAAILESWLLGENSGLALCDLLFGEVCPSGRLAETIPNRVEDVPSHLFFPGAMGQVVYGEGLYVGYRYYDTVEAPVCYPFGYGLSYGHTQISQVKVLPDETVQTDNTFRVKATVTNDSQLASAQVVQVYVRPPKSDKVSRPAHELKGFAKVHLAAGESKEVEIELPAAAFAYWHLQLADWKVDGGSYLIEVGTSSRDLVASLPVEIVDDGKRLPLDEFSTVAQWRQDPVGSQIIADFMAEKGMVVPESDTMKAMWLQSPIKNMAMFSSATTNMEEIKQLVQCWQQGNKQ